MADALCGPSNPLQNFQKHTSVDRSLQHDRLIGRQGPSQTFRSGLASNPGALDPEFEAFQQGLSAHAPPHFDTHHPLQNHFSPQPQQSHFQAPSALPDWANDFQRLHISPAHPASSQQTPHTIHQAPIARHSPQASWHQDFMQSQAPQMPAFQPMSGMYSWNNGQQGSQFLPQPSLVAQGKQREIVQENTQFDAAAFDAAFEQVQEDALAAEIQAEREEIEALVAKKEAELTAQRNVHAQTNHLTDMDLSQSIEQDLQESEPWPDTMATEYPAALLDELDQDMERSRSATPLQETQKETPPQNVFTDEELARTAGALLDSVSHDTSQKFQESVFLQLMRRIRDKEVRVEGEHFVENNEASPGITTTTKMAEPIPLTASWHIPEQDYDAFDRMVFGEDESEEMVDVPVVEPTIRVPSRPLTPEIDPPAPTLDVWRERLSLPIPGAESPTYSSAGRWGPTPPPMGSPFASPFE